MRACIAASKLASIFACTIKNASFTVFSSEDFCVGKAAASTAAPFSKCADRSSAFSAEAASLPGERFRKRRAQFPSLLPSPSLLQLASVFFLSYLSSFLTRRVSRDLWPPPRAKQHHGLQFSWPLGLNTLHNLSEKLSDRMPDRQIE